MKKDTTVRKSISWSYVKDQFQSHQEAIEVESDPRQMEALVEDLRGMVIEYVQGLQRNTAVGLGHDPTPRGESVLDVTHGVFAEILGCRYGTQLIDEVREQQRITTATGYAARQTMGPAKRALCRLFTSMHDSFQLASGSGVSETLVTEAKSWLRRMNHNLPLCRYDELRGLVDYSLFDESHNGVNYVLLIEQVISTTISTAAVKMCRDADTDRGLLIQFLGPWSELHREYPDDIGEIQYIDPGSHIMWYTYWLREIFTHMEGEPINRVYQAVVALSNILQGNVVGTPENTPPFAIPCITALGMGDAWELAEAVHLEFLLRHNYTAVDVLRDDVPPATFEWLPSDMMPWIRELYSAFSLIESDGDDTPLDVCAASQNLITDIRGDDSRSTFGPLGVMLGWSHTIEPADSYD